MAPVVPCGRFSSCGGSNQTMVERKARSRQPRRLSSSAMASTSKRLATWCTGVCGAGESGDAGGVSREGLLFCCDSLFSAAKGEIMRGPHAVRPISNHPLRLLRALHLAVHARPCAACGGGDAPQVKSPPQALSSASAHSIDRAAMDPKVRRATISFFMPMAIGTRTRKYRRTAPISAYGLGSRRRSSGAITICSMKPRRLLRVGGPEDWRLLRQLPR